MAALWPPSSLLSHCITAAAALNHPPSLYTGASDGSIVYWSLSPLDPHRPFSPTALLCGHAAEISALSTCSPELSKPSSILSACTAGVLCVWTRGTNRCRRRRRIPPSAGSPSLASPLPAYPRHVTIACEFSVLVVDSLTLNVVRTLIHDNSSIMPVKHMAVFEDEGTETTAHAVLLFDSLVRARILKLSSESDLNEETAKVLNIVSFTEVESVAISGDGKIAAFFFPTHCLFKSVPNGALLGELSLTNDSVSKVHPIGGMFIEDDRHSGFKSFVVWSSNGAAMVYMVLASDAEFRLVSVCEIPEISYSVDRELSVRFCELNGNLVRIESISSFEPNVTIWSVPQFELGIGNLVPSKMIGQGNFGGVTFGTRFSSRENNLGERQEKETGQEFVGGSSNSIVRVSEHEKDDLGSDKRVVSSSIVLEDFYALYAVVYGFSNGEIEVVRFFNPFPEPDYQTNNHVSERQLSGHAGAAVLCLATHCMVAKSGEQNLRRALISGSKDSTVRVWDLDSGDLLVVMHHHIAPVRSIVLPPPGTNLPWSDCFLSVGDDGCVSLVSLETLRVERIFPGHPSYPSLVAWDSARGYVACLCKNISSSSSSDSIDVLYLWDVKAGARERIIRGTASHSMFEHFCEGIDRNSITGGGILGETTSASSLLPPVANDSSTRSVDNGMSMFPETSKSHRRSTDYIELNTFPLKSGGKGNGDVRSHQYEKHPVKCYCPYPGIASLKFDLLSLMSPHYKQSSDEQVKTHASSLETRQRVDSHPLMESLEGCLLRFSLCVLHLWDIDRDLDRLLTEEMNVCKPERCRVASGLMGDRGSLTLMFPGFHATLELWKSSSEFCAMRSLTIVSIAQRMVSLSHSCTAASSALAAFYTRNFAEKVPDIKPPLLQLLVSFWQDPSEHVRMAARSLFYCAAPRAIPHPLCDTSRTSTTSYKDLARPIEGIKSYEPEESTIIAWLESFETEEWIFYIEGTNQDAKASNIIVAAALVVWYPSIVNDNLAHLIVNQLIKLVMSTNDQYSSTAAELLGEGMEGTWKSCIGFEIPKIIGDIFFQIECLTGVPPNDSAIKNTALSANVREALVGTLLPSLAMADIPGFLNAIEGQIWATSSDSPVHLVSLKTLLRVVRGSPKPLAPYLDKVVNFVLQTMDPGNLVMRKTCLKSSMVTLREIARVFPMVSLNESLTRLAVGDAIVDSHNVTIRVYDTESVTKVKVLDASGPLGLPSFLETTSNTRIAPAITALSFSPDGEGLVAFSENGLMIRWWSLGSAWWEKLSRSLVPVHCTKLIFVPPWEGFSPNSSRSSIMASITGHGQRVGSQDKAKLLDDVDVLKLLLHNLDLSYRLQWTAARSVSLTRHGQELGIFQL